MPGFATTVRRAAAILAVSAGILVTIPLQASVPGSIADPPAGKAGTAPIRRLATIGASATAGFNVYFWRVDGDGHVRDSTNLAKLLRASSGDELVVTDLGTGQFFANPAGIGSMAIERALRSNPDIVVGLDFLFWFCFGTVGPEATRMRTMEDRLAMLEVGFELLERIEDAGIPLVVGDIPDMSAAGGGIMLKSQVPSPETIERANERIHEWASTRPGIRVFPLAGLQSLLESNDPIEVDGSALGDAERRRLLQGDRLHPTVGGLIVMVDRLVDLMQDDDALGGRLPSMTTRYDELMRRVSGFPSLEAQEDHVRRRRAEPAGSGEAVER